MFRIRIWIWILQLTNFGNDTGDDELLLAGGLDGGAEVGVVPGVDFTLATDEGGVGVHVGDLLQQQAVGALVGGTGQDSGDVEDLSESGVAQHGVAEVVGAVVTDDLGKTDLVVDDEKSLRVSDWYSKWN